MLLLQKVNFTQTSTTLTGLVGDLLGLPVGNGVVGLAVGGLVGCTKLR